MIDLMKRSRNCMIVVCNKLMLYIYNVACMMHVKDLGKLDCKMKVHNN